MMSWRTCSGGFWVCGIVLVLLCLSACSAAGNADILAGNFYASRGNNAADIEAWQRALAFSSSGGSDSAAPYAAYNLGALYMSLNEDPAAIGRFERSLELAALAPDDGNRAKELLYRAHYNAALAQFRLGDYDAAAAGFRDALRADSTRLNAKINLELCQKEQEAVREREARAAPVSGQKSAARDQVFNFLREAETRRWQSFVTEEEVPPDGLDY
jgi:tetratricopeptide (TPR) repeat protein